MLVVFWSSSIQTLTLLVRAVDVVKCVDNGGEGTLVGFWEKARGMWIWLGKSKGMYVVCSNQDQKGIVIN